MVQQNIAERPLNIINILNNFRSFIKQVYQKHQTQNINKKKDQSNYFKREISQKEEKLLSLKVKKKIDFYNRENLLLFLESNFYEIKFANTYMPYEKLAIAFDINTFKLF